MLVHLHVDNNKLVLVNEVVKSVCPYCKTYGDIRLYVAQPYVRIFFLPAAPGKKEISATCLTCDERFSPALFTENLKQRYESVKKRAPWWMYSGISICVALLVACIFIIVIMKQQEAKGIQNPQVGDVYTMKVKDKDYSLIKVTKVTGDSVYLVQNQFVMENNNVYGALSEKPYFTDVHTIHKKQLKLWYDDDTIVDVNKEE
ncbi:MAG: hypothetical protein ACLGH8_12110 [Bacteroidia bacterium]